MSPRPLGQKWRISVIGNGAWPAKLKRMKFKFCSNCDALNRVADEGLDRPAATCGKCGMPLGDLKSADELSESQTDKLIRNSKNLVVVDIFADWCGPCQSYMPIFQEIGRKYYDKAEFVKLNADKARNFSSKYSIRGVPYTLFFKDGKLIAQQQGLIPQNQLEQQVLSSL